MWLWDQRPEPRVRPTGMIRPICLIGVGVVSDRTAGHLITLANEQRGIVAGLLLDRPPRGLTLAVATIEHGQAGRVSLVGAPGVVDDELVEHAFQEPDVIATVQSEDTKSRPSFERRHQVAEAKHWLMQSQIGAAARGATHYRVIGETGAIVGGPP